jgi:hypothetical protein
MVLAVLLVMDENIKWRAVPGGLQVLRLMVESRG